MNAEDIVRALAANEARDFFSNEGLEGCILCGSDAEDGPPEAHHEACEWRLACEWVAEHGGVSVGSPPHGDVEGPR